MALHDQSAKTHEAICQSLIEENKKYRITLQYISDDSETQTSGHFGMNRLAGYAKKTLSGSDWLDEFEKDERIAELQEDCETLARSVLAQCNPTHWQGNDDTCKRFACVLARKVLG